MSETNNRKVAKAPSSRARRAFLVAFPKPAILPVKTGVIGRTALKDAGVLDGTVSEEHLKVTLDGPYPKIARAQGARNGVWVEGFPLDEGESVILHDGAIVRLSETILVYREAYEGPEKPVGSIGAVVAPFTLHALRERLDEIVGPSARATPRILIEGQSGTGKEGLARAVHEELRVHRKRGSDYETFNASSIPSELCEALLFGVAKGAHAAAYRDEKGLFLRNDGGTVFLDEIGDLPLGLQSKLLRFLDSGEIQPVGAPSVQVDVAIVAATNVGIKAKVDAGVFRRDLAARFSKSIHLPPLADRVEDIPSILLAMSKKENQELRVELHPDEPEQRPASQDGRLNRVEAEAMERLMLRVFEANARDLWSHVEAAIGKAYSARRRSESARTRENAAIPVLQSWALEIASTVPVRAPRALPKKLLEQAIRATGRQTDGALARHLGVNEKWVEGAMKLSRLP